MRPTTLPTPSSGPFRTNLGALSARTLAGALAAGCVLEWVRNRK